MEPMLAPKDIEIMRLKDVLQAMINSIGTVTQNDGRRSANIVNAAEFFQAYDTALEILSALP